MEMRFELRADVENQCWSLRIDGNEWDSGLTTAEVLDTIRRHTTATMDCLLHEEVANA